MIRTFFISLVICIMFTSCHNGDWEFPDYDYTAVYFAYQTPVRTIVLGEDIFDTTLDNAHKCQIIATMGGVYDNNNNIEISYRVDNSLCEGLTFDGTNSVMAMPSNYYSLSTDKFVIKKGEILGRVDVQLTDAFFADPLALKNTYVIPVVMTNVLGADSILRGTPLVANPNRAIASDWDVVPKDYILYAVKYINPWDANYLRRGKDVVTGTQNKTVVRHKQYVENDEVVRIYTGSLNTAVFPVEIRDESETLMDCKLLLTFDGSGKCTISSASDNVTISGSGSFVEKGEKNSWGNQDRNALYLNYNISFTNGLKYETVDTLVVRDRGISSETFSPELK